MDDLIRRQDAIKAVYDMVEHLARSSIYWNDLKAVAKERIDVIPSASNWIPVSERYPTKEGVYLVTVMGSIGFSYYTIDETERSYFWTLGVEAWQEPPKPYKEESNGTH